MFRFGNLLTSDTLLLETVLLRFERRLQELLLCGGHSRRWNGRLLLVLFDEFGGELPCIFQRQILNLIRGLYPHCLTVFEQLLHCSAVERLSLLSVPSLLLCGATLRIGRTER